jgi:HK97 gp10 family phage protein
MSAIEQLERLSKLNLATASKAGDEVLRDEIFKNWQEIDPDASDDEVVVTDEGVVVQLEEGQAMYIEYGTNTMEAQPFIRPALETKQGEIEKAVADNLNEQMKALVA